MAKMPFMRDGYHSDIDQWVKNPTHNQVGHNAVDAFFRMLDLPEISPDSPDLLLLIDAVACPAKAVWTRASNFVVELAAKHESVRHVCGTAMTTRTTDFKTRLVASLKLSVGKSQIPREWLTQILCAASADRSARVRGKAIQMIEALGFKHLLSEIHAAASPKTASLAQFHGDLLANGYYIEPNTEKDSESIQLVVRYDQGYTSQRVPRDVADHLGLPKVAELIRQAVKTYAHVDWSSHRNTPITPEGK